MALAGAADQHGVARPPPSPPSAIPRSSTSFTGEAKKSKSGGSAAPRRQAEGQQMRRIAEIQIKMSKARARLNNPEAELPETEQAEIAAAVRWLGTASKHAPRS